MRKATQSWKVALAILSLLFTVFIWAQGLNQSFSRPSVTSKLSLNQSEIAFLAEPSIPEALRPIVLSNDPRELLKKELLELPINELTERNKLSLAALEEIDKERQRQLSQLVLSNTSLNDYRDVLLSELTAESNNNNLLANIDPSNKDVLLDKLICQRLNNSSDICIDKYVSNSMSLRLYFIQFLPIFSVLFGSLLLFKAAWTFLKKGTESWPQMVSMPLSLIDMVLLIAGGFVLLGEVISPAIVIPIFNILDKQLSIPIRESLQVLIGYVAMAAPPLLILRKQLLGVPGTDNPSGGWFQWKLYPIKTALFKAFKGWLMVIPLVLLVSWLMNLTVGDQGGSNPLLEMVLQSQNSIALIILVFTIVVLAPCFEEIIFRGTLLPILVKELGITFGVIISAFVFALAHLSVGELPPLLVLGMGLALLRISSGRLLPCVLMHSLWNGITFVNLLLLSPY